MVFKRSSLSFDLFSRGHIEDVYDICWTRDGNFMVSGSVDNTAIMWDINKGLWLHTHTLSVLFFLSRYFDFLSVMMLVCRTEAFYREWPQELRAGGHLGSSGTIYCHSQLWQVKKLNVAHLLQGSRCCAFRDASVVTTAYFSYRWLLISSKQLWHSSLISGSNKAISLRELQLPGYFSLDYVYMPTCTEHWLDICINERLNRCTW